MDITMVLEAIQNVGFPIVCVGALGWIFYYILKFVLGELIANREERSRFIEVLNKFDIRLSVIENTVDEISDAVKHKE